MGFCEKKYKLVLVLVQSMFGDGHVIMANETTSH